MIRFFSTAHKLWINEPCEISPSKALKIISGRNTQKAYFSDGRLASEKGGESVSERTKGKRKRFSHQSVKQKLDIRTKVGWKTASQQGL